MDACITYFAQSILWHNQAVQASLVSNALREIDSLGGQPLPHGPPCCFLAILVEPLEDDMDPGEVRGEHLMWMCGEKEKSAWLNPLVHYPNTHTHTHTHTHT